MLSNAYFLAKFRFDTAENEPAQNLLNFANFADFADPDLLRFVARPAAAVLARGRGRRRRLRRPLGRGAPRCHFYTLANREYQIMIFCVSQDSKRPRGSTATPGSCPANHLDHPSRVVGPLNEGTLGSGSAYDVQPPGTAC